MRTARSALFAALALLCATPAAAEEYRSSFVPLGPGVPGLLYEPLAPGPKAGIGIVAMHSTVDYLTPNPAGPCIQLAQRGYRVLCANTSTSKSGFMSDIDEDKLMLNVKLAVAQLRAQPGIRRVVLFGHSAGGGMMAAYQNIAENGLKACQGPEKLIRCADTLAGLPAADGLMLIDSTLGTPGTALFSLDPAVPDADGGQPLNPALDVYNPANGFDPKGAHYDKPFIARFFAAQGARMNALIARAQARLAAIDAGTGRFRDDEPFLVPGDHPNENKLNAQDASLQAHTRQPWLLLHAGGRISNEIVHTVRLPKGADSPTPWLARGALNTTVRHFLNAYAVRTTADYGYDASSFRGIDYHSSYAIVLNSVEGIRKPLLQMGMTGSFEFFVAETVREHAASDDKTLAFVEGALHGFTPCTECARAKGLAPDHYGDTVKTLFDYIDGWLSKPGRF